MDKNIYVTPHVSLLAATSVIVPEVAARTCYDSFHKTDDKSINSKNWRKFANSETSNISSINPTFQSDLAEELAHVYHHESVIEHTLCSFEVLRVGRGVLQELARHRVGVSLSVRSTRYTLKRIIAVYIASEGSLTVFRDLAEVYLQGLLTVSSENVLWNVEMTKIAQMLNRYTQEYGYENFLKDVLSKEALLYVKQGSITEAKADENYEYLMNCKDKRNAGDSIKFIVSDLWATNLVVTFNARSLAHFMKLRDSGAAWFPIRELAQEIYKVTPEAIQRLVKKPKKEKKDAK